MGVTDNNSTPAASTAAASSSVPTRSMAQTCLARPARNDATVWR
jgi:hypothetical protein